MPISKSSGVGIALLVGFGLGMWLIILVFTLTPHPQFESVILDNAERFSVWGIKGDSYELTFTDRTGARRFISGVNSKNYLLTPGQRVRIMWSVPYGYYIEMLEN